MADNLTVAEIGSFHVGGRPVSLSFLPPKDVVFTAGRGKFRLWDRVQWQPVHQAGELAAVNERQVLSELGL